MAKDSLLNIILNIVQQGSGAKDAQKDMGDLGGELDSLATSILGDVIGFTTLSGAVYAVTEAIKQDIAEASDAEATLARLGATLQSTGRSSETSTAQIHQMAENMRGLFDTESIEQAANALMRYMDIPTSQIPSDLVLIENMAAGLGVSMPQAAETLGMALETGRLRGLGFSREMQNTISTMMTAGNIAQADTIIMEQLNQKFSGQAAADLNTYAGSVDRLNNSEKEYAESVGQEWIPTITDYNNALAALYDQQTKVNEVSAAFGEMTIRYRTAQIAATESTNNKSLAVDGETGKERDYILVANNATTTTKALADATALAAAAQKQATSDANFLNDALSIMVNSDKSIKDIEDQLAVARKQGYSDAGAHITDLKSKLQESQEAEHTALLKMVDQFIFTTQVMTGKMDMTTYLDLEQHQGLITTQEEVMAQDWLAYANTVANNPVNGSVTVTTYSQDGGQLFPGGKLAGSGGNPVAQQRGAGGSVDPNSYLWNENASSRPEVFVSGGGYILTKQDAEAALGGGANVQFVVNYSPMISFADEAELKMRLAPLIDQLVQKSKGRI